MTALKSAHPPSRSDPYLQALIGDLTRLEGSTAATRELVVDKLTEQAHLDGVGLDTPEMTRRVVEEATSAAGIVQGQYIALMRESALGFLKTHSQYRQLATIPVAMLPTNLLNGQACFNPSGDPFILIDSGMMRQLTDIMHAYRSFLTWGFGEQVHCRDHSQVDFAQTLIGLTIVVMSQDASLNQLCPALMEKCPSMRRGSERAEAIVRYASRARDFVLLHEYGHVALGHLECSRKSALAFGPGTVTLARSTHSQEYEADSFAIAALVAMREKLSHEFSSDHMVLALGEAVGVLFRFWDLLAALLSVQGNKLPDTHPPSISRWRRIHDSFRYPGMKKDFLSDVDDAFETILKWYRLPPADVRAA